MPDALAGKGQFVAWKYGRMRSSGKREKIPIDPATGKRAKVDNPDTWGTLEEARRRAQEDGLNGVGFVFVGNDPFVGIDLDGCRDPGTGAIDAWAQKVIERFDSYAEISPSGTGVKIVAKGEIQGKGKRRGPVEIYDRKRFFTLTGEVLEGYEAVEPRQEALQRLYARVAPGGAQAKPQRTQEAVPVEVEGLIERAREADNGLKFRRLFDEGDTSGYSSPSEAEMALAGILAFWTVRDRVRMEILMRASALRRDKWDRHPTYLKNTVDLAASGCQRTYNPKPCAEGSVHKLLEEMRGYAVSAPWTGRSGPRERWLYHALINTGGFYGKACPDGVIVAAGSRDLALKCGTKRTTVERLLGKLQERGLLRLMEKGSGKKASKYLLFRPPLRGVHKEENPHNNTLCLYYGPLLTRIRDSAPQTDKEFDKNGAKIPHDTSHILRSLGGFRALIIEKILAWPGMTLQEIASVLGRAPRTVKGSLPMLVEGGFVEDAGGIYSCPENLSDRLLDELSDSGCLHREDRLRDDYQQDRAHYEDRRREKRLGALAIECGLEPDGLIVELEPVEDQSKSQVQRLFASGEPTQDSGCPMSDVIRNEEEVFELARSYFGLAPETRECDREREDQEQPLSDLAVAVRDYLDRNPRDANEPAGWLANTLWAYDLASIQPGEPGREAVKAALEELAAVEVAA